MCDHLEKEHSRKREPASAAGEGLRLAGCRVPRRRGWEGTGEVPNTGSNHAVSW